MAKWRWALPVVMTTAYVGLCVNAASAYGTMERAACGGLGCLGTGYSTRPAFLRAIVSGPFLVTWQTPIPNRHTLLATLIMAPTVFVFWWWMGCLVEGCRVRTRLMRILLAVVGLALSVLVFWNVRWTFDFALINGAGEWRNWRMLFSGLFVPDSLVWLVHGVWMVVLVALWFFTVFRGMRKTTQTADPSWLRSSG